jgi:chromosome segregation ATPase
MDAVDLEDATDELYGLTPADFTARRTELAAQARQEGLKDLAKAISDLRRPTVSAWLVNQLARGAGGASAEIQELEQLGADLRAAQAELDGPRMKELAKQRQKLVAALIRRADTVADDGQKVSAGVRRELEETLAAAVADEQASLAVTSGRLTRALVYAGFGEVDVTAATATPVTGKRRHLQSAPKHQSNEDVSPKKADPEATGEAEKVDQAEQARQALVDELAVVRADEAAAIDDLEAAAQHRDELRAQEAELTETLADLQREIVRVRHELDDLTRTGAAADRDHQRRQRQLDQARKAVRQAEKAVDAQAADQN